MADLRVRQDVDPEVARHRLQHTGCQRCGTPSSPAKFLLDVDYGSAQVLCMHCFNTDEVNALLAWLCDEELTEGVEFGLNLARLNQHGIVVDALNGYRMSVPPGVTPS